MERPGLRLNEERQYRGFDASSQAIQCQQSGVHVPCVQQQNDCLDVVDGSHEKTEKESQAVQARDCIGLFVVQKKTPARDEQGFQNMELADIYHPA